MNYRNCLLILDRDGCLIEKPQNSRYVDDLNKVVLIEESISYLSSIKDSGIKFAVVTNQRGVAKGLYTLELVLQIHNFIAQRIGLELQNFKLYVCPHDIDTCDCRKPKPRLLFEAMKDAFVSVDHTYFVGDSESDLIAAERAGINFFGLNFAPRSNKISAIEISSFSEIHEVMVNNDYR